MSFRITAVVVTLAALAGCASTGVVQTDKDVFLISKQSAAGIFGTPDGVRADIYAEANAHCAKSSKAVETVSAEVKDAKPFVRQGSASLQFRCIDK
jgi:hypothetical protein